MPRRREPSVSPWRLPRQPARPRPQVRQRASLRLYRSTAPATDTAIASSKGSVSGGCRRSWRDPSGPSDEAWQALKRRHVVLIRAAGAERLMLDRLCLDGDPPLRCEVDRVRAALGGWRETQATGAAEAELMTASHPVRTTSSSPPSRGNAN